MKPILKSKYTREGLYLLLFFALSFFFFYKNLDFSQSLRMGDTSLWLNTQISENMQEGHNAFWFDNYFTDSRGEFIMARVSSLLLMLVKPYQYPQLSLIVHIFLAGYLMFLFLRTIGLSISAAIFGGIAFMFTNNTLTLIYAGHLGKFESAAYYPGALLFLYKAVTDKKWYYYPLSGSFLAMSFLGFQVDVSAYYALFLGVFFLHLLYKEAQDGVIKYWKERLPALGKEVALFVLLAATSAIFAFQAIDFMMFEVAGEGESDKEEISDAQKWQFATRWSMPPEETIELIVPGFFGLRSGDPVNPYRGRMARWDGEHKYSNFKLNGENIGYILFVFMLLACFAVSSKGKRFWVISCVVFLLLSFGRYFPILYGLIYRLPRFDSFRNPHKFMHLFSVSSAVLGAMGFNYFSSFLRAKEEDNLIEKLSDKEVVRLNYFNKTLYAFCIASFVALIISILGRDSIIQSLSGWNMAVGRDVSIIMTDNITNALFRFFMFTVLGASLTAFFLTMRSTISGAEKAIPVASFAILSIFLLTRDIAPYLSKISVMYQPDMVANEEKTLFFFAIISFIAVLAYLVILVVPTKKNIFYKTIEVFLIFILAFDLFHTGQYYVLTESVANYEKMNPIIRTIKRETSERQGRINFLSRAGMMNYFLTETFPYHGLETLNPPAASRSRSDVEAFMNAFRINDGLPYHPRLYQLLNVRYVLADKPINSLFSNYLIKEDDMKYGNQIISLYSLGFERPRYEIVGNVEEAKDFKAAIKKMTRPSFDPLKTAVIHDETAKEYLKDKDLSSTNIIEWKGMKSYISDTRVDYEISTPEAGLFVLKDLYHSDWKAYVDNRQEPILRVDAVLRGVYVEEGTHVISFRYEPKTPWFFVTLLGWLCVILIPIIIFVIKRLRKE